MSNVNENYQLEVVRKSNRIIQALGNPSLLAEKVFLLSLVKVEDRDNTSVSVLNKEKYKRILNATGTDFSKGLVAEMSNIELRNLTNTSSGSYYNNIKALLNPSKTDPGTLRNNLVFMAPDKDGVFGYTEFITGVAYDNGVMYIKFNSEESIRREILNLKDNFALLDVSLMMQWRSIYTYRVYELIESNVGYEESMRTKRGKDPKDSYKFTYELGQLKFLLGILDATADSTVKAAIASGVKPDYNAIAEEMTKRTGEGKAYAKFADFKRYALDKAEKEINNCQSKDCEYIIHFEPRRNGKGGKVIAVDLFVNRRNIKENTDEITALPVTAMSDDDKLEFIDMMRKTSLNDLSLKDLKSLAELANYDMDKINKAISVAENATIKTNKAGFVAEAIRNNWEPRTAYTSTDKAGDLLQNDYDFEQLEEKLLRL